MGTIIGYIDKSLKWVLSKIYHFDNWHITSLSQRKYALDIVRFGNNYGNRNSACEIGCGMGDIIRNLKFKNRVGMDIDPAVLKAASLLTKISCQSIKYNTFKFPDDELIGSFDIIIMVNWIHHIDPTTLKIKISDFFQKNLSQKGCIIIDTVQDKDYEFNHDINLLTNGLNCEILSVGRYPRQREIWSIKNYKQ